MISLWNNDEAKMTQDLFFDLDSIGRREISRIVEGIKRETDELMTINCRLDADCRQLELAKRELELKIDLMGDDDEGNEATEDRQDMVSLLCDALSESIPQNNEWLIL